MSERIFSEQHLTYMNQLLLPSGGRPLSDQAQLAVSGMNCVLSRSRESISQQPYGFLISHVANCVGQEQSIVTGVTRIVRNAGLLAARELPRDSMVAQLYGSSNPPTLFVPQANGYGEWFFRPERRPDCSRTEQDDIVASMRPNPRKVLEALVAGEGGSLRDFIPPEALKNALDLFLRTGVIVRGTESTAYQLTDTGHWLGLGLGSVTRVKSPVPSSRRIYQPPPKPEESAPPPKPRPEPPLPPPKPAAEKQTGEPVGVVEQWVITMVIDLYATKSHDIIKLVSQLIRDGVLKISEVGQHPNKDGVQVYSPDKSRQLKFSGYAKKHTTPAQRRAILFWTKTDMLFYGGHLTSKVIEQELDLAADSLETHVPRVIYRPLVEAIAADKALSKQREANN